jgi:putative oxidoreductase
MTTNLDTRLASYQSPVLSIFRIVFGLMFTLHGTIKLFGWPLGTSIPVGTWPAWWAGLIELVTGVLITVGLSPASPLSSRRARWRWPTSG